jgi:ectoine hydroxylase-related dioxygenase (phytanoyl-CoA dioxygenase family)
MEQQMSSATLGGICTVDARTQDAISDEQARYFRNNGLLLIRNAIAPDELKSLQDATYPLYRRAVEERPADPDYCYARHELTGEMTPFRIEYIINKDASGACRRLLGHPFILRSIEKLQGRNFIPTWDSMVFKKEGMGKAIPWHRDSAPYAGADVDNSVAAINVDFYLDGSDMSNCLWGIPGSNRWSTAEADAEIARTCSAVRASS